MIYFSIELNLLFNGLDETLSTSQELMSAVSNAAACIGGVCRTGFIYRPVFVFVSHKLCVYTVQ